MKIVIEIPDEVYKELTETAIIVKEVYPLTIDRALTEGIVLPKGHGDLKDATTLKKMFEDKEGDDFTAFHFYDAIDDCPTIIEADKEEAEE